MNSEVGVMAKRTGVGGLVARVARCLQDPDFPTGDHAALRRLRPDGPELRHAVALYRLMEDVGISVSDADGLKRWAAIINALALCWGAHDPRQSCGAALAAMRFGEERLATLLTADYDTLIDLLPRIARRLRAANEPMDWYPLTRLVLDVGRDEARADDTRSRIAREYVRAERQQSNQAQQPGA